MGTFYQSLKITGWTKTTFFQYAISSCQYDFRIYGFPQLAQTWFLFYHSWDIDVSTATNLQNLSSIFQGSQNGLISNDCYDATSCALFYVSLFNVVNGNLYPASYLFTVQLWLWFDVTVTPPINLPMTPEEVDIQTIQTMKQFYRSTFLATPTDFFMNKSRALVYTSDVLAQTTREQRANAKFQTIPFVDSQQYLPVYTTIVAVNSAINNSMIDCAIELARNMCGRWCHVQYHCW